MYSKDKYSLFIQDSNEMDRQQLVRYDHLLRFGPNGRQALRRVILRIEEIAKMVRVSA